MGASPESSPLDGIDRQLLQLLQRDARHATAVEIAEQVGVSDGTVRNRIESLERAGVIEGYAPMIDYERAGYPLQIRFLCTARIVDREPMARDALEIEGVVEVHEIMTGRRNVEVKAVAAANDDVTRVALELDEMGLAIESETLIRHHYHRPFNHFGAEEVTTDATGTYDV